MADKFTVRAVVCFLGIFALFGLGGLMWLIGGKPSAADAALIAIVSGPVGTALGGLVGLLVNANSAPHDVNVVNDNRDPVPTTDTSGRHAVTG